MKERTPYCAS